MFYPQQLITKGIAWMFGSTLAVSLIYLTVTWIIVVPIIALFPYSGSIEKLLHSLALLLILTMWTFPAILVLFGLSAGAYFGVGSILIGALLGTAISFSEYKGWKRIYVYAIALFLLSLASLGWVYVVGRGGSNTLSILMGYLPSLIFVILGLGITFLLLREAQRMREAEA